MSVLALCNVGVRDVTLDGQALNPAREAGRQAWDKYEDSAPRLDFPILRPCLDYIIAQHPAGVDRLVLFGTDQPDPAHQARDTLYFAALAARRLPELLADSVQQVERQLVQGINPSLYDEALEEFDALLAALPRQGLQVCYVIISSGIPACNTALLLQGVRHYDDRLRVVYLPQGGEPQELRAGRQVTDAFREAAAIEHLQRWDFANALPRLERLGAGPGLVGLAAYAAQRLAFDFCSAQDTLLQTWRDGNQSARAFITGRIRHDLDALLDDGGDRLGALLCELYWNALITWRHRRYADFLGRVYRFQEAVLRYLVERVFGLPTDLAPGARQANQARWNAGIRANAALLEFLQTRVVNDRPLDWQDVSRPTYKALLSYATKEGLGLDAGGQPLIPPQERKRYVALLARVNAFDRLVELRHRTIIGHDFEGVSQALILENYKGASAQGERRAPVQGMAEVLGMLGLQTQNNPYQAVAEFVISSLRE